jgi:hypothetical protein
MRYIDYFTLPHFSQDKDGLYQARLLVGLILVFTIAILAFMLFFLLGPDFSLQERLAGTVPTAMLGACFVGLLFVIRQKGYYKLSVHILITAIYLGIASGVFMTGGPLNTPSGTLLIVPVFLSYCLLDRKSGTVWAAIVLSINLIGMAMSASGFEFPVVTKPEMLETTRGFNWVMAFFSLIALMYVTETMNQGLRKERDIERNRYKDIATLASNNDFVNKAAIDLAESGQKLWQSTQAQHATIQSVAATTEQLNASAEQNTVLTHAAIEEIKKTEAQITVSNDNIQALSDSMNEIRELSDDIKNITGLVSEIAYQTNLLSLNAMIEASRAGDENGGFKVVALEVKKLAERSASAVENINKLLDSNLNAVGRGVESSEKIKTNFDDISATAKPLSQTIRRVSEASLEQNQAIKQIVNALDDITQLLESNNQLSEENSDLAQKLQSNAAELANAFNKL